MKTSKKIVIIVIVVLIIKCVLIGGVFGAIFLIDKGLTKGVNEIGELASDNTETTADTFETYEDTTLGITEAQ